MANTIQGNVYVIDSGSIFLTGSNGTALAGSSDGDYPKMLISNIGLYGADSTAELAISYLSNTAQVTYHLRCPVDGGYADIHFATPHMVSEPLFVNTISAGTGYIYLS